MNSHPNILTAKPVFFSWLPELARSMRLLSALAALLMANVHISSAFASELLGIRFGPDGDKTRVVFDLVGAPDFSIKGELEGEGRLIVNFNDMRSGPEGINGFRGKGLVARYAYAPDGRNETQFILTFKQTAKIADIFVLDPKASVKKHRLVIDLLASDKTSFLASIPRRAERTPEKTPLPTVNPTGSESDKQIDSNDSDLLGALMARENIVSGAKDAPNSAQPNPPKATNPLKTARDQPRAREVQPNKHKDSGSAESGPIIMTNRAPQSSGSPSVSRSPVPTVLPAISQAKSSIIAPSLKPGLQLGLQPGSAQIASADIPDITRQQQSVARKKAALITVVIDPGHGGNHPGAVGPSGTLEKDVNLAAALVLEDVLKKTGRYRPILTRRSDILVDLPVRAQIAHDNNAKLFISLHADGNDNKELRGSSVYTLSDEGKKRSIEEARSSRNYKIGDADMADFSPVLGTILFDVSQDGNDKESRKFADMLLGRLRGVTPLVKNAKRSEDLKVLLRPDLPAVLLEMAFISNASDEANLTDPHWHKRTMRAVARAVDDYFADKPLATIQAAGAVGSSRGGN